ncbi:glycoside hydrolase family 2 TIM barrel-domain containing protein [Hirschia litorea]|uniref:Glycoside hydrolase family 2 TIM barrel-domain containing protein n=1 Tax=Hirschia litorea TaxID=1199156 RepID=A0ABW2IQ04_9PROT
MRILTIAALIPSAFIASSGCANLLAQTSQSTALAQKETASPRTRTLLTKDWKFELGEKYDGAYAVDWNDSKWRTLDLPHDWSIEGEYKQDNPAGARGGFLPGGIGWYRKSLNWDEKFEGKSVSLTFDGVYMNPEVYLNGKKMWSQPYGYTGFSFDITDHLEKGNNIIAVGVDNENLPSGRWYTGSGIYRNVWLTVTDPIHVIENGSFVRADNISKAQATLHTTHDIANDTDTPIEALAIVKIKAPNGKIVAQTSSTVTLDANKQTSITHELNVKNPALWSPESPSLYTSVLEIHKEYQLIDTYETRTGIRNLEFTVDRGFLINGQPLEIQGMCLHHDAGGVGAAVPKDVWRYRLSLLKKAGVNAVRTAHNPFAPEFYDLTDELGIMVMDEAFDGWETKKAAADYGLFFEDWWQRDLDSFIKRDRNHPSVIMWSIGNEVKSATEETQEKLVNYVKSLDDTRPITQGRGYYLSHADIAGFNGHGEYVNGIEDFHAEHPDTPIVGTEITHTLHTRDYYKSKTEIRDRDILKNKKKWAELKDKIYEVPDLTEEEVWPEVSTLHASSFDNNIVRMPIREEIKLARKLPYLLGTFRWTGFDYLGESRGWPARTTNYGVVDLAGFPKGPYYLYKSQWTTEPMVYLEPHWTHPGKEGVTLPVIAYTNLEKAELFVNGKSQGEKIMTDDLQIQWNVPYHSGEIKVIARGKNGETQTMTRKTAGPPAKLSVSMDRNSLPADNVSVARIEIDIVDAQGTRNPSADNRIKVSVQGGGELIALESGAILDIESTKADNRKAFNGKLLALVQSNGLKQPIQVTIESSDIPTQTVNIDTHAP